MGGPSSHVSRVRSEGTHRNTLVTAWKVSVTGIEFINDYWLRENGNNRVNKGKDSIDYPKIKENFGGWGRGPYLGIPQETIDKATPGIEVPLPWDWEGEDNLHQAACYRRQKPICMKVRLHSSHPAPSFRSFTLQVDPIVKNGGAAELTSGSVSVDWPAGMEEHVVQITTGGQLPSEIARFDLRLTWSVKGLIIFTKDDDPADGVAGVINRTRHTIYAIYDDPLNPLVSNESGEKWSADTGLTTQRLDKLLVAIGAKNHRFPTPTADDIDDLIWLLHKHVNDSSPPYFYGARDERVRYGLNGPPLDVMDQWVMWLASNSWNRPSEPKHWNFGACITYVQLMKTMLGMAGINSRRAWLYPKTTHLPKSKKYPNGRDIELANSDLVSLDDEKKTAQPQTGIIHYKNGIDYNVQVRLIDKPGANGDILAENFEACLYYGGKVVPAAIPTRRYPADVLNLEIGFKNPTEMLRWWHDLKHGDFQRFMAWVSVSPQGYFDNDGNGYESPYLIPREKWLPVP